MVNFQRLNMLERKLLISMLKGDFESFIIIFLITELIMEQHHGNDFVPLRTGTKKERYQRVRSQFQARLDSNSHPLANTSNLLAILKQQFEWWWVGYYWLSNKETKQQHLALGQFQGPPACTRLFKGNGVCGTTWQRKQSIFLQNVNTFPGHIACSSASKSQIVVPIFSKGQFVGVLDIDSANFGEFDKTDDEQLKFLLSQIDEIGHFQWFQKNI